MSNFTEARLNALRWLAERNGDGVFDKHQVLVAAGEKGPFHRATWNALRDLELVEFYAEGWRCRLTEKGREAAR